ncbi:hypothetical protein [Halopelagius fulvigenes]|uniref:Uncharacterized protein n=1 Tax=Halopelagius fulvigenes TaxID=1198324 RepID=A0ABD5TT33_9EURY
MDNKKKSRRSVLKLTGATAIGSTFIGTSAAASSNKKKSDETINTDFNPNNESEVINFLTQLSDFSVDEQRSIFENELNKEQQQAVIEGLQPHDVEVKLIQSEPVVSISSIGYRTQKAVYEVTTRDAAGKNLWRFAHRCIWDYNGSKVRNISSTPIGQTNSPYWSYEGASGNVDNRNTYFIANKQGRFKFCPFQIGCVASDEPMIEIRGQADGTDTANSNFD